MNASLTPPLLLSVVRGVVGGALDAETMEKEEEAREQKEEDEHETPAQRMRRQAEQALLLAKSPRYSLFSLFQFCVYAPYEFPALFAS